MSILHAQLEACRASLSVAHAASGLGWKAGNDQIARLLRSSEGAVRAAIALLEASALMDNREHGSITGKHPHRICRKRDADTKHKRVLVLDDVVAYPWEVPPPPDVHNMFGRMPHSPLSANP